MTGATTTKRLNGDKMKITPEDLTLEETQKQFPHVQTSCNHILMFDHPMPIPGDLVTCGRCKRTAYIIASDARPYLAECDTCDMTHYCDTPQRLIKVVTNHKAKTRGQHTIHVRYLSATTPCPEWAHDKIMKGLGL